MDRSPSQWHQSHHGDSAKAGHTAAKPVWSWSFSAFAWAIHKWNWTTTGNLSCHPGTDLWGLKGFERFLLCFFPTVTSKLEQKQLCLLQASGLTLSILARRIARSSWVYLCFDGKGSFTTMVVIVWEACGAAGESGESLTSTTSFSFSGVWSRTVDATSEPPPLSGVSSNSSSTLNCSSAARSGGGVTWRGAWASKGWESGSYKGWSGGSCVSGRTGCATNSTPRDSARHASA